MRIAIVGAGAIGCRIAAHLIQSGAACTLTLLDTWAEHVDALDRDGLCFRRRGVENRFPVRAYTFDQAPLETFDVVLLAVRSDATKAALPLIQRLLASDGFVVSCQNGLNEEEIASVVGPERTAGCSMIFGARLTAPAEVTVLEGPDTLRLGEFKGTVTPRIAASAVTAALPAWANTWPERTIRIVAPFTPGAATDFVSRALAQKLSYLLGQPVVVENRPGAAGTIAAEAVAKANPDGYTVLFGEPGGLTVAPAVMGNLRFDPMRDLTPIAQAVSLPMIVLAHPSVEATDLQGLAAVARRKSLDYATNGTGSIQHLTMELLASRLGIEMVHVPYRGGSLAINDLIAGQVPLSMLTVPTAATYIKSGKVKALGILDSRRSPLLPDVPTAQEQGVQDASVPIWGGLFAPSQTPAAVLQRLSEATQGALKDPALRQRLEEAGNDVVFRDPAEFGAVVKADAEKWRKLVASAGIRIE